MLIEIHILQNHAPSNLNRDDTGSPKECVFGGVKRARISSQCLKRSIRRSPGFQQTLAGHLATRTRRLPEIVRERFLLDENADVKGLAEIAAQKATGFGTKEGKQRPAEKDGKLATAQTMFLTDRDLDAVANALLKAAREDGDAKKFAARKAADLQKDAQQQGFREMTVDIALFGRMVTSEAFRDVEAAAQVAHAISTHKVAHEFDYYTAVDDLSGTGEEEEDAGADMIGDVEFNSACYYKYFSIHRDGLVDNLCGANVPRHSVSDEARAGSEELAARTIASLLEAAVRVSPTGKQNSFAAHQLPAAVLVEVRPHATPVSYANAFVGPARESSTLDLAAASLHKLKSHVEALTRGFDLESTGRWLLAPEVPEDKLSIEGVDRVASLRELCDRVRVVAQDGGANG